MTAYAEEHQETNRCFLPTTGIIILDYRGANSAEPHNRAQDKAALFGFSYRNVSPKETANDITAVTQAWLRTLYQSCTIGVEAVPWSAVKRRYR